MMPNRISSERDCPCCGIPESTSGCVIGPRCACDRTKRCEICLHCVSHHVKSCTEDVWAEHQELMAKLRARHKINIFDVGESQTYPSKGGHGPGY
jgi:hypothetical protein